MMSWSQSEKPSPDVTQHQHSNSQTPFLSPSQSSIQLRSEPLIDVHTHILPPYIPNWEAKFGYPGFIGLEDIKDEDTKDKKMMKGDRFFRRVQCNCFDHTFREAEMKSSFVTMQVLSTVPVMFNYWAKPQDCLETCEFINDHMANVCTQNPDKFIGLGTIPMQDVDLACKELKRCVNDLKLKGVEIGTHVNEKNLDDPMFEPFWQCVEDLDAVVFVHPWDMMGGQRLEKHWLSWLVSMPAETATAISCMIFGGVYKRHPKLKVYYAHGGGSFIGILARIQQGYDCRPDLFPEQCDPKQYLKHIVVDSLTHDPDMLELLLKHMGPDNVMIGSDYPFPLGEPEDVGRAVKKLLLRKEHTAELRRKIFYQNACKFFNIKISSLSSPKVDKLAIHNISLSDSVKGVDHEAHTHTDPYVESDSAIGITTDSQSVSSMLKVDEITSDPVSYCNTLTVETLGQILRELCKAYYDKRPFVDNGTYDKMVGNLRSRDEHNIFFMTN